MELKTSSRVCAALCVLLLSLPASDGCPPTPPQPDKTPPVLVEGTCPSPRTVYVKNPSTGIAVQWPEPMATDPSTPVKVARADEGPANGREFFINDSPYYISYSATDAEGNERNPICTFNITVLLEGEKIPQK
ncbi:uncharacterized protein LOC110975890 [Acanthaster planci]|uniref:Uncharacterized protein LOC110975890 n=1 Tax=Acanthaster planci TaxID=133434 RepID=A0A8B7XW24_ACAPL|nr:uncharacterized protein LOC110975890 [Acanthaster planci]